MRVKIAPEFIWRKLRQWVHQRHYHLFKLGWYKVPRQPLANFPSGMSITHIANTGITAIDNFCTPEEAQHFIATAGSKIEPSSVVVDGDNMQSAGRTSQSSFMPLGSSDKRLQDLVFRAASVFGLPVSYCERMSITRYGEGEYYKAHFDYGDTFGADRMYTCLIYLSELTDTQGGGTWFSKLNLVARPKLGRAICWVNTDSDGKRHPETHHAALPPVGEGVEKWVVQLWFRGYPATRSMQKPVPRSGIQGEALAPDAVLPEGVKHSGQLTYDNAYTIPGPNKEA
ncbi:MAG: 2OG-Fe(II) oxygenase [Gammaproteobacteria bacterium]|nr:2OG-Fe(II) oxygenase [Gammaproteobacteria bacterium]